jgi:tRNA 5-methylaminomethyl-2-thiouridine biosynthesis bifunctional protein
MLAGRPSIRLVTGHRATLIERQSGRWAVSDRTRSVAHAAVVVVASAISAPSLLQSQFSPVRPIRGRVTRLAAGELACLRAGITGQGYLVPGTDGHVAIGATYETVGPDDGPGISESSAHESNLQRLARMLDQPGAPRIDGVFDGVRCVATDRRPLAGAVGDERAALTGAVSLQGAHVCDLPRRDDLYCNFALGSHGLVLAPLMGELLACLIEGEPLPIERSLVTGVDPARFLLRHLRRNISRSAISG